MKRLSDTEMMDYMDGALSPERSASVEAHLGQNPDDAQLLADLKMAQATLHEMEAGDPIRASDDFWQKVRAELPQPRQSAPAKGVLAQLGSWLWPAQSPMGMSLRVAVLAAFLAMMATWFGPSQTQAPTIADPVASKQLSPEQRANIATRKAAKRDAKPLPGAVDANESADTNN